MIKAVKIAFKESLTIQHASALNGTQLVHASWLGIKRLVNLRFALLFHPIYHRAIDGSLSALLILLFHDYHLSFAIWTSSLAAISRASNN